MRDQSEPTHRHRWYPRPEDEREIVRHKSFALHHRTIDDAASDIDLLDHSFYLFTESRTGQDSVLYRAGATGYRLAQVTSPHPVDLAPHRTHLTISTQPAPAMTSEGAVERLNLLDLPFLFFLDANHHRGAVLYQAWITPDRAVSCSEVHIPDLGGGGRDVALPTGTPEQRFDATLGEPAA